MGRGRICAWFLASLFLASYASAAIVLGTQDTFEDQTLEGWDGGVNGILTGGPGGAADHFLRASSGSFGAVPNLAIENARPAGDIANPPAHRWSGNYTAGGVTRIEADLKVLNGDDLSMRVVLFGGTSGSSRITSTVPVTLVADGSWHHLVFDITPAAVTRVVGADSIANILANVNRLMMRNQTGAPLPGGTPVSAEVGFDNITALPEPASIAVLSLAMCCLRPRGNNLR